MRRALVALGACVTVVGCGSSLTAPTVKGQPPEYVEPAGSTGTGSPTDERAPLPAAAPSVEPAKLPGAPPSATSAAPPTSLTLDGGAH